MPEFIDPVFAKASPKRSFSLIENERVGLVIAKTGSIHAAGNGIFICPRKKACPLDDVSCSSITVSAIARVFYVSGVAVIFDFVSVGVGGGSDICLDLPAFPKSVHQTHVS